MPAYSFQCSKKTCKTVFEEICTFSDFDQGFPNVKCPKCGKKKPKRAITAPAFGNNPDKMNNFEYAAQKNFNNAQIQSHTAREEASKKGIVSPYADLPDFTDNGRRMNFVD